MSDENAVKVAVQIINKRGLHARASAKFVSTVAKFQSEITVERAENIVSGKSIMGLMMLGASLGTTINIAATGPDASQALAALVQLCEARFDEDE